MASTMPRWTVIGLLLFSSATAQAWSNHALITWVALGADRPIAAAAPVTTETLDEFLQRNASGIAATLDEVEAWAQRAVPAYPPRPAALRFDGGGDAATLRVRFLAALRANPAAGAVLFVQSLPDRSPPLSPGAAPVRPSIPERDLVPESNLTDVPYRFVALRPGEAVRPLEVVAAASDEPDYGLDVGLFEDNGTAFGARYGWGTQSLGNKKLAYGSQAPFHMGFFHEASLVYRLAGFLRRMYPEYRIGSFLALSRYAFATGHDYWGWRFLGWALHYVEDLTQPYHAAALPHKSTAGMLWNNALDLAGISGPRAAMVTRATNRHLALENFQLHMLAAALAAGDGSRPVIVALTDVNTDAALPPFDETSPRAAITVAARARAAAIDATLLATLPARYVDDPAYTYSVDEPAVDIAALVRASPAAEPHLTSETADLLRATGSWARQAVHSVRPHP